MRTTHHAARSAFRRTPLFTAIACALLSPAAMAVPDLVVTNTSDSGTLGSLRYAINYANANCGTDANPVITFAIPATGPFVISPSVTMPSFSCISAPVAYNPTIDGMSQFGSVANSDANGFNAQVMIVLDGSINYGGGCAISHNDTGYGGTLLVKGVEIRNWSYGGQTGICGRVNLLGNRIHSNNYGVSASPNSFIGGPNPSDRNVIANHAYGDAIDFDGPIAVVNNFIGTMDGVTAAPNDSGVYYTCCTQPSGQIKDNVIISTYSAIETYYDDVMTISGNRINTDVSGTNLLGSGSYGISVYYSYGAQITGNIVGGMNTGVDLYSNQNVVVSGNHIGVNAAGTAPISNGTGIYDQSSTATRIEANVISGNADTGVYLGNTFNNVVYGNFIGTDYGGTVAIPNFIGAYLGSGPSNNVFDANVISGNAHAGLYLSDASTTTVRSNKIGTNGSGSGALPNEYGVFAECGTNNTFDANNISGNAYGGLIAAAIQNSLFVGNLIGGTIPNGGHGLILDHTFCGSLELGPGGQVRTKSIVFGADNYSTDNQLQGNVIAGNNGVGVHIIGGDRNSIFQNQIYSNMIDGVRIDSTFDSYGAPVSAGVFNPILENVIYGNGAKNVNLGFDGAPLPNDPGDADSGKPNNWQNRPVINSAVHDPVNGWTTIGFTLDSRAGDYRVDFFANAAPGAPAGQTYLGNTFINLPADGASSGSWSYSSLTVDNISAIATRMENPALSRLPGGAVLGPFAADSSEFADQVAASTLPVPGVNILPTSIDFGDVVVGRTAGPSTITVTSTGTAPYVIGNLRDTDCRGAAICSTGSFLCTTTCAEATPYSAGQQCVINATFAPAAIGPQTKTLAICDNAAGSPRALTLTGNGVPVPDVDISMTPSFYSFGSISVGQQSGVQSFTVKNLGTTQVYLGTVSVTGDFLINGSSCGSTLAGGATCAADVIFSPVAPGLANGLVQVTASNQPPASPAALRAKVTTPTTVTVSARVQGSGLQFGDLSLPATMGFGSLVLHSAVATQNLEIRNVGNGPLTISSITVSGPFTLTNGCGPSLAPGSSCVAAVSFNPTTLGTYNGLLTVISDAPGGSRAIALSATVFAEARPLVRVNATALGFGERLMGSDSPPQRLTVTNDGAQAAQLSPFTFTQPEPGRQEFSVFATNCGVTLAPQASCTADVIFKPLSFGPRAGEMQVTSNSADSPQKVQLGGTGCRPFTPTGGRSPGRDPCAP